MLTPTTKTIGQVLAVHLGFHTLWVLAYLVSLLGVFILIPFTGLYNAFVLGFMGKSVLSSSANAALLGYLVFLMTGLLCGWLISLFHPKSVWISAFCSLLSTCVLLVGASAIRYTVVGVSGIQSILPLPATTGRADADEMSMALKDAYLSAGEVPQYFPGKPLILPLTELQPSLPLLSKGFQLQDGPYVYCNLPPGVWRVFKSQPENSRCPVLWNTRPDPAGKRFVFSIDLKTDIFHDELVSEEALTRMLTTMEDAVRKQTGDANFKLRE